MEFATVCVLLAGLTQPVGRARSNTNSNGSGLVRPCLGPARSDQASRRSNSIEGGFQMFKSDTVRSGMVGR